MKTKGLEPISSDGCSDIDASRLCCKLFATFTDCRAVKIVGIESIGTEGIQAQQLPLQITGLLTPMWVRSESQPSIVNLWLRVAIMTIKSRSR